MGERRMGRYHNRYGPIHTNWLTSRLTFKGNVMIDERWLGNALDVSLTPSTNPELVAQWRRYAEACHVEGTPAIVQLNHPGRQSPLGAGSKGLFEKNIAPSPIPLQFEDNIWAKTAQKLIFGTPREMSVAEIEDVVKKHADAAKFLSEAGFDGVELHAAHGYLLNIFMAPQTNQRQDNYGGSAFNRARIVLDIINAIRAVVPSTFTVGIKLNSADTQRSSDMEEVMQQIGYLKDTGIDFLEISGGSYENPRMMKGDEALAGEKPVSERTAKREAFFLDFARVVRQRFPDVVLMVTGGFRSLAGMHAALEENACDLIGLARPAAVDPSWANKVLEEEAKGGDVSLRLAAVKPSWLVSKIPVKALGAGAESVSLIVSDRKLWMLTWL
jgi:2,4-dienoyl-CoA reductase-like NADH-dependent reductase (Old Yellow Enzyme family)